MKSIYDKEDFTIEDIQSLIDNQVEESIYLDFKDARSLDRSEKKRTDISKDVASFANSDGGIIVYGISEINHVASQISYIDGNEFTKEWLEQVINSSVQRHIDGIKIYPVRNGGNIEETVYIVKIPASVDAPHISRDNRYYKRYNFLSTPMEEYEVRQTYGRKRNTKLKIFNWRISNRNQEYDNEWSVIHLSIQAKNESNAVEASYKVNVILSGMNDYIDLKWSVTDTNFNVTVISKENMKITAVCKDPIYPDEIVNVIHCKLLISKEFPIKAVENVIGTIQLLYSNGSDEETFDLKDAISKLYHCYIGL